MTNEGSCCLFIRTKLTILQNCGLRDVKRKSNQSEAGAEEEKRSQKILGKPIVLVNELEIVVDSISDHSEVVSVYTETCISTS